MTNELIVLCLSLESDAVFRWGDKEAHQRDQSREKQAYNANQQKGVKNFSFVEDDRVLPRNSLKDGGKDGLLTAGWTEPYTQDHPAQRCLYSV